MGNTDEWLGCVRSPEFLKYFGNPAPTSFPSPTDVSSWDQPQRFGLECLKTCSSGFPRDWAYVEYLRMKDYCCWHQVPDEPFITLYFKHLKVLIFVEMTKKNASFLCLYELFRIG